VLLHSYRSRGWGGVSHGDRSVFMAAYSGSDYSAIFGRESTREHKGVRRILVFFKSDIGSNEKMVGIKNMNLLYSHLLGSFISCSLVITL